MNLIKCLENYVHYIFRIYKQLFVWKEFSIFEFYIMRRVVRISLGWKYPVSEIEEYYMWNIGLLEVIVWEFFYQE